MEISKIYTAPLFKNVEKHLLDELVNTHSIISFPEGMQLIHKDLHNRRAYILIEGEVSIHDENDRIISISKPLSILGEISALDANLPIASVMTQTDCKVLAITEEELWALCEKSHAFTSNLLFIVVERIRSFSALLEKSKDRTKKMQKKAYLDASTGLLNRTWLQENADKLINHHHRTAIPLSLMISDIDNFKGINDTYGHDTGDLVLRQVAMMLQSITEKKSYSIRLGGDEMCILFSGIAYQEALVIVERLHSAVQKTVFKHSGGKTLSITASFGISTLTKDMSMKELMKRADLALYEAKESGRNRVNAFKASSVAVSE